MNHSSYLHSFSKDYNTLLVVQRLAQFLGWDAQFGAHVCLDDYNSRLCVCLQAGEGTHIEEG